MNAMTRILTAAAAVACSAMPVTEAWSQVSKDFVNPKIVLLGRSEAPGDGAYWNARFQQAGAIDPKRVPIRERMIKRRVLESFAEFLSPLRLPRTLRIIASDCSGGAYDSPFYAPSFRLINICYAYVGQSEAMADEITSNSSKVKRWIPTTRAQLIAGEFAATVLHEAGHALFDILGAPVFGNEEDAADQMLAFLALQFNKEIARTVIKADAYYYEWSASRGGRPTAIDHFSGVHGLNLQRTYNLLCMAYGGQREAFQDLVNSGWLPADRAKNCAREYQKVLLAFRKTIYPFIDQAQMKKVQARRNWFEPQELKDK